MEGSGGMIVLHILLNIFLVLLCVLGGLLLLLLLLSLFPVRASLDFRTEFSLEVGYLFLKFAVLPGKEETEEPEKKEGPKKDKDEKTKKKSPGIVNRGKTALKREGFTGFLQALFELLGLLLRAPVRILKHLKLKRFDLYLLLAGGEDASAAAIRYGQVSAGVYSACGGLFSLLPCKRKGVTVDLDYDAPENLVDFSGEISILPVFVLKEALVLVIKGLRPLKKII